MKGKLWWLLPAYTSMAVIYLALEAFPATKESCLLVPGVSEASCAAWVQAVGSVLALAATGWGAVHQARSAARADGSRAADSLRACALRLAMSGGQMLAWVRCAAGIDGRERFASERVAVFTREVALHPYASVSFADMPTPTATAAYALIVTAFDACRLVSWNEDAEMISSAWVAEQEKNIKDALEELYKEADRLERNEPDSKSPSAGANRFMELGRNIHP